MVDDTDWAATVERARADGMKAGRQEGFREGFAYATAILKQHTPSMYANASLNATSVGGTEKCERCGSPMYPDMNARRTPDGHWFCMDCWEHLVTKATELTEPEEANADQA